jgi:hypothetical protein
MQKQGVLLCEQKRKGTRYSIMGSPCSFLKPYFLTPVERPLRPAAI